MSVRARQDLRLSGGARGLGLLALVIPVAVVAGAVPPLLGLAVDRGRLVPGPRWPRPAGRPRPPLLVAAEALAVGVGLRAGAADLGGPPRGPRRPRLHRRAAPGLAGRGCSRSAPQTALLLAVPLAAYGVITAEEVFSAVTWGIASLGIGLIAGVGEQQPAGLLRPPGPLPLRPEAPPRADRPLRRPELRAGPGRPGLHDPAHRARRAADRGAACSTSRAATPSPRCSPTRRRTRAPALLDELAVEAWSRNRQVVAGRAFAFPLGTERRPLGGRRRPALRPGRAAQQIGLEERVDELGTRLARQRRPPRHRPALRGLPRLRDRRRAPPAGP